MTKKIALFLLLTLSLSCTSTLSYKYLKSPELVEANRPDYPECFFMNISDLHVYDNSLGTEGKAFEHYLEEDRKLLRESLAISQKALSVISEHKPRFLLVSGDLTKDGELDSHELISGLLKNLEKQGIDVYVVPGNHDINNPDALRFLGDTTEPAEQVSPERFREIYSDLGYDKALKEDPHSLSYVAEPVPGLWLLALDTCRYEENHEKNTPVIGGNLTQDQIDWIETVLEEALLKNKAVMVMMHHGVYEHYKGQKKYFTDYVIDQYQGISSMLASYQARLVFTGHYHAQDIVKFTTEDKKDFLYDIETGSLVSYPNPIRSFRIAGNQEMEIQSFYVEEVPGVDTHELSFQDYSLRFTQDGIETIAIKTMMSLGMSIEESRKLSTSIAEAFMAHYKGDENFEGQEMVPLKGLSFMGGIIIGTRKDLIHELWADTEPGDNKITINLRAGEWF
ncbi:MAG: metallophosphoesterase [Spirochaetales bacterium]|nr:metallophosphoesterase [Spirochaetales bacterium]